MPRNIGGKTINRQLGMTVSIQITMGSGIDWWRGFRSGACCGTSGGASVTNRLC